MLYTAPAITIYSCFIAALLGACMGSFLNCAAWRIVHGESVLRGRSHCDVCGHVLAPRDLGAGVQLCVQPWPLPLLRREALPPPRGG